MERNYRVSDSEMEVMKMLWRQKEGIKQSQLLDLFTKEGKEWKRQTLNTFLSRLETKGLVIRERGLVRAAVERRNIIFRRPKMQLIICMVGSLVISLRHLSGEMPLIKKILRN